MRRDTKGCMFKPPNFVIARQVSATRCTSLTLGSRRGRGRSASGDHDRRLARTGTRRSTTTAACTRRAGTTWSVCFMMVFLLQEDLLWQGTAMLWLAILRRRALCVCVAAVRMCKLFNLLHNSIQWSAKNGNTLVAMSFDVRLRQRFSQRFSALDRAVNVRQPFAAGWWRHILMQTEDSN